MVKRGGRGWDKSPAAKFQALADLYAELPVMECQGLCADSCFSLEQTRLERAYVRHGTGVELGLVQVPPSACPALGLLNRCTVREFRPLVCRLWGMTAGMRCQYGCVPVGGFLSAAQAYEFVARVTELDGDPVAADRLRAVFAADPEGADRVMLGLQRERDLQHADRVRRARNPVFLLGPGRLSKERPRGL